MSGDFGPRVTLPATLRALESHSGLHASLVGDSDSIEKTLAELGAFEGEREQLRERVSLEPAASVLPMDATPRDALRGAQDSSLHRSIDLLAAGNVDGVVSAGNTAALITLGRRHISMLPGFSRPAYCAGMPVQSGFRYMLDLGANVDCDAESLLEFARLGTTLINVLEDCPKPRVALLCNGTEGNKGNLAIREAAQRMKDDPVLNFAGFIEGNELLQNGPELIVCDGMLGNVALKTAEGTAEFAARLIADSFAQHWWLRLVAMAAVTANRVTGRRFDLGRHCG